MSVSSVTGGSAPQIQSQNNAAAGIKGELRQLIQAIKSGDLTAAQSAYDSLDSQLQQSSTASGSTSGDSSSDPFKQFLQQVGAALANNDIQGAQQALSGLQQTKDAHHHRHHGGGDANDQASSSSTTSGSSASTASAGVSSATGVNVVV
jgi:ribosomal protein S20